MEASDRWHKDAVPPCERRVRQREAARVLVRAEGKVLLGSDSDPGIAGSHWWVTPGGGLEAGESFAQAAARELAEETGLKVVPDDLIGPIARRVVHHGYSDQVLIQSEEFFLLDLPACFEPNTAGFTAEERIKMAGGFRWFRPEELAARTVWPAEITELMQATGSEEPLDWAQVEESTVAVSLGHRQEVEREGTLAASEPDTRGTVGNHR